MSSSDCRVPTVLGTAYAQGPYPYAESDRISGLREEDAGVRLGVAYAQSAYPSAEGDRAVVEGLRERDARVRLGVSAEAPEGPMDGIGAAYDRFAYSSAEADRLYGLREDDARILLKGLREDDAKILLRGLREGDASILLKGLREQDAGVILKGLREQDAAILLKGLREDDASIRLSGLREDDAQILLRGIGRISGLLAAEDFHPRFQAQLGGWLDFLKPLPGDEEYMAKIRVVVEGWNRIKPQLYALPAQSKTAIINNMTAAKCDPGRYDGMAAFLAEGAAAKTEGRWERVQRLEAYLPTLQKLIDQYKALGAAVAAQTPTQTQQAVNQQAIQDVALRASALPKPDVLMDYILPYGGVALGSAAVVLIGMKLAGK